MAPLWSFWALLTGYSLLLCSSKIEPISQQAGERHTDENKDFSCWFCVFCKRSRSRFLLARSVASPSCPRHQGSLSLALPSWQLHCCSGLFGPCWALSSRSGLQSWIILTCNVTRILWEQCPRLSSAAVSPRASWVCADGEWQGRHQENWAPSPCSHSPSAPPPQKGQQVALFW